MKLMLSGIYDKRVFEFARANAKGSYSFDFRPTSFNFIQMYILEELLSSNELMQDESVELMFGKDAPHVIEAVVTSARKYHSDVKIHIMDSSAYSLEELELLKCPFILNFSIEDQDIFRKILSTSCAGVVFEYEHLHKLFCNGQYNSFISNFYSKVLVAKKSKFEISINSGWDISPASSIIDTLEIDSIRYHVNTHIERCYRNVDIPKATKLLSDVRNSLAI